MGNFIEFNTAYKSGSRLITESHKELLEYNGWRKYRTVILDEENNTDITLNVEKPSNITQNFVGKHIEDYNFFKKKFEIIYQNTKMRNTIVV